MEKITTHIVKLDGVCFIGNDIVCQNDFDHARRAKIFREMFETVAEFADFLHQQYRAADKAFSGATRSRHDHGFAACHKKLYFERRAAWLLSQNPHFNGRIK